MERLAERGTAICLDAADEGEKISNIISVLGLYPGVARDSLRMALDASVRNEVS
jgi:hypothetical protein